MFNLDSSQCTRSFICQGEEVKEIPDPVILQENSFLALSSPENINFNALGVLTSQDLGLDPENKIIHHFVEEGDTISSIAKQFNIDIDTILWANNLSKSSILKVGKKLIILPISGTMHVVEKGDTLSQVAKLHKADSNEIIAFNNLNSDGKIYIGDILIVPDGTQPKATVIYSSNLVSIPNSYFICPVPSPAKITQGLHWYNAIDFSTGKCGSPVFAAAGGTVQRTGYSSVGGRYVRVLHPNGVVTYYGHLSSKIVSSGQSVSQGQIIGYIGHSGITIPAGSLGCHLHFDVRGAKNPFRGYSVGTVF